MDKTIKKIFILTLITIIFTWGLFNYDIIGDFLTTISILISPFILGVIIAFILNIPMNFLEKNILKNTKNKTLLKLKRAISLIISLIILITVLIFTIILVIPELINAITLLAETISDELPQVENYLNSALETYSLNTEDIFEGLNISIREITEGGLSVIMSNLNNILGGTFQIIISLLGGITNLILGLIFAIYMLVSKETLKQQTDTLVQATLKKKDYIITKYLANLTSVTFKKFVTGQVTEALILGSLCFVGMLILGFPYAATIGVLTGVLALIPIIGAFIAGVIGVILIFPVNPIQAIWYIVFILVLQQIEGNLIYPKVVGNSIGLPGLWVLLAVTIGATLWGIAGMIVMVPLFSIIYYLSKKYIKAKNISKTTKGYSEDNPMKFKEAFLLVIEEDKEKVETPKVKQPKEKNIES